MINKLLLSIFTLFILNAQNIDIQIDSTKSIEAKQDDKIIIREYTYYALDDDTELSAKSKALSHLKIELSEEIGTAIESKLEINKNNEHRYIRHEISTLSVGITRLIILNEQWHNREYYIKAKVRINEKQTLLLLADAIRAKGKQKEIDKLNKLLRAQGYTIETLNKKVNLLNDKLENSIPIVKIIAKTKASYAGLTSAYGFYIGQSYALDLIKSNYPSLHNNVLIARKRFDSTFAESLKSIKSILLKNKKLFHNSNKELDQVLHDLKIGSKKDAINFIKLVHKRANGEIPSPIIENLLMYNPIFDKYPIKELQNGFKQTFYSNGSGKAKGIEFEVSLPKSWKSSEAYRPNIVRKFISQNGYGNAIISILVKKLSIPKGIILSTQDINNYIITDATIKMTPPNSQLLEYGRFVLEGLPGYWQDIQMHLNRGKNSMNIRMLQYIFFYQNRAIIIQYAVHDLNGRIDKNKHFILFDKYKSIADWVVNSFVLMNRY